MSDKRTKSCTFALLLQRRFAGGFMRKSFWKLRCKKTTEHVEDFFCVFDENLVGLHRTNEAD